MTFKEAQDAYLIFEPINIIIIIVFVVMAIGLMYLLEMKFFKGSEMGWLKSFLIVMPILLVGMNIPAKIYKKEMNELNNKIEEQYIEKLPKEKMDVLSYGNVDIADVEIKNYYFTQEENEILILKVRLNKDGIIKEKIIKARVKVVKDLKQAYLEYQILERDLSPSEEDIEFEKGYYNTTLYIPE